MIGPNVLTHRGMHQEIHPSSWNQEYIQAKLSRSEKGLDFFDKLTWMSLNLTFCSNLSVSSRLGKYHDCFQLTKYSLNWSDCIILKITGIVISRFLPPPPSINSSPFGFRSCQKCEKRAS